MPSKKDISISVSKLGMNKDSHISNLGEAEYPHAKNSNFFEENGEGFNIQNEHSNILASKFKEGFKVVGFVNNVNLNETYYFLTNPETSFSEIGRIKGETTLPDLQDTIVDCDDCNQAITEVLPLDEITQTESQVYETILSDWSEQDDCSNPGCLNFNIDHPIKTGLIKDEKCGKILYWTDDFNPPRYVELDELDQYGFVGNILCGEDNTQEVCLACDKLNMFRDAIVPITEASEVVLGGNLKRGVYQAVIAYCDESGNEQSRYFTVTEPVSIFDEQNNILLKSQLADETNYALKINVQNLDTAYTHYKVVIIQNTDINRATSYFIEGIHSTSDNTVIYTTDRNKLTTSLDKLVQFAVRVDKLEKITTANNYLIGKGVTYKKRKNLQKVVNLIGEFVQWQTHIASENLYKDGVKAATHRQFLRDETYPLSIRFIEDGDYSPTFPLIGRQIKTGENAEIPQSNDDRASINGAGKDCSTESIDRRWQIYNTASFLGNFPQEAGIETVEVTTVDTQSCEILAVGEHVTDYEASDLPIEITIEDNDSYINLQLFLEQNLETILSTPDGDLAPGLLAIKNLYTLSNYTADNCNLVIDECESGETTDCCEIVTDGVGDPILEEVIRTAEILNEVTTFIPATFPDDYPSAIPPRNCSLLANPTAGSDIPRIYERVSISRFFILNGFDERDPISNLTSDYPFETSPSIAESIEPTQDLNTNVTSFFVNYFFALSEADLNSTIPATTILSEWNTSYTYPAFIAKSAKWFKLQQFEERFVISMSRDTASPTYFFNTREYRISLYKSTSSAPIYTTLKSVISSLSLNLKKDNDDLIIVDDSGTTTTITSGAADSYFLAIDTPRIELSYNGDPATLFTDEGKSLWLFEEQEDPENPNTFIDVEVPPTHFTPASTGCFSLVLLEEINKSVEITYDSITVDKIQSYQVSCTYNEPVVTDDCTAIPFAFGEMAYTQSTEEYPDNKELYDSTDLKIKPADIPTDEFYQGVTFRDYFEQKYTNAGAVDANGDYILLATKTVDGIERAILDLTCSNIRHFKLPDNKVSPFMYERELSKFSDSFIYPMGLKVDGKIVETALSIAVKNDLITQEEKDKIQGFELLRGDRTAEKSILGKGLTFDLYEYENNNRTISYANYPLNSLGADTLHYSSSVRNPSNLIQHPSNSVSNYKWTFSSPDTDYERVTTPPLMKVEAYMYGSTLGNFDLVEDHPKWTILGGRLERTARNLAALEVTAEIVIQSMQAFSNYEQQVGLAQNTVFAGAWIASPVITALNILSSIVYKYARYEYEWLETFRNLGKRRNFAAYYTTVGKYNNINSNIVEGDSLRYLNIRNNIKSGRTIFTDKIEGDRLELNHVDREDAILLSTGKTFPITYPEKYRNYDNSSTNSSNASRTFSSQAGVCNKGLSDPVEKKTASMYVSLKNYLPSQYGTIGSVKWIPISKRGFFNQDNLFFGGDTFICRHTLRRPFPFFLSTAFDQGDMTPYEYKFYTNIGEEPRFFCNFQTDSDERRGGQLIPKKTSEYNFDCETNANGAYLKEPSKFYLYYNGIPSFLTESTINTNFRHAEPEPWNNFYPNEADYMRWTQQKENPIRRGNTFLYNRNYSLQTTPTGVLTLPTIYNQEDYDCRTDAPNGVIYSLPDNSENNYIDPWLIFRPNDKYEFPTKYGKLQAIKGIESEQVLAVFDNTTAIFNAYDQLMDDGQRPETREIGLGGIFARRPRVFTETELGYAGTQHFTILSCEYGHFMVDSDRGQIFMVQPGGQNLTEISSQSNKESSNMRNWFKQNLPFKIKKYFPNVDIDNPYNGFGIVMGYDSRYQRVFITKKDFIPANKDIIEEREGVLYITENSTERRIEEGDLIDTSWTISYSLQTGKWTSFFDFKPNYYVNHNDYFQTGKNTNDAEFGLWSHLLTNKSYQVFYGKKYDWEIEVPIQNKGANQVLESISYMLDSRRYFNEYDFIQNKELGFDRAYVYNNSNTSGHLKLVLQKSLRDLSKYPKIEGQSQSILQSQQDGIMRFNYFYNRVKKESSGIPLFTNDIDGVNKQINTNAISFFGKRLLERLRGDSFVVNFSSSDTKHKKIFKLAQFQKNLYTK